MTASKIFRKNIVALCGGVGGAKLALGLSHVLPPEQLTIVVNTGDDFEHLGLKICPDLDTVLYTLAGVNNPETGWGRAEETWSCMEVLEALGSETWFKLGDKDLALHLERAHMLASGQSLSAVTSHFCKQLGVSANVVPMSDDPVRTMIETPEGVLSFQHYFVKEQCAPCVEGFHFEGVTAAHANRAFLNALDDPNLGGIIFCPSNPFVSIGPILELPSIRERIGSLRAPRIAISPIIGGRAVKGPAAKMMHELDLPVSSLAVATHYKGLLDGLIIDQVDASEKVEIERHMASLVCPTLMNTLRDRIDLARSSLDFLKDLT